MDTLVSLLRFAVGLHVNERLTNATFTRRGTEGLNGHEPTRWTQLPHFHRLVTRWLGLLVLAAGIAGTFSNALALATAGRGAFWIIFWYGVYVTQRVCRKRGHYQDKYVALHRRLAPIVGWTRHVDPRAWLTIPLPYRENPDSAVVLVMPPEFKETKALKKRVVDSASSVLGLHNPDVSWSTGVTPQTCTLRTRPAPPARVTYKDLLPFLEKRSPGQIVMGIKPGNLGMVIDTRGENPHTALSVTTGGGKSVTAGVFAMQILHDGGIAMVCDIKRISVPWAKRLDSVKYCSAIEDVHDALCWLNSEIDRRFQVIEDTADDDGNVDVEAVGPPLLVILEEANTLIPDLVTYYASIRETEDPKVSPAILAIRRGLAMGRGGRVTFLGIAQYLTANAIGGSAARENFSTRILMKPNFRVWNLLVGPEHKVDGKWPESTNAPGRAHVLNNGVIEECQIALVEPKEAKDYATNGVVTVFPGRVPSVSPTADVIELCGDTGTPHLQALPAPPSGPELVTLAEACTQRVIPMNYEAAKKARQRARKADPDGFPVIKRVDGNRELYDPDELRDFFDIRGVGVGV